MYWSSISPFRKKLKIISYFQWFLHNFSRFTQKNPKRPNGQSANMAQNVSKMMYFKKNQVCEIPRGDKRF